MGKILGNLDIEKIVLNHINSGKKPISLTKKYSITKQQLSYYLRKLTRKGLIKKVSNGVWESSTNFTKLSSTNSFVSTIKKNKRGHGYIWDVKLRKNLKNWKDREQILKKLNINYKHTGNTIRIILKGKKIWLNNNSITIFEPNDFIAATPLETRKMAILELINTIKLIQSKLKINLGNYKFKCRREHIGIIKDPLAIKCNKEDMKIIVYDKNGEGWMEIDNSLNLDETEFRKTKHNSAITNSEGFENYFNQHKEHNWKVNPEFILKTMNGIQQNQLIFAENMRSHINAVQQLGNGVKELTKAVKDIQTKKNKVSLKEYQKSLSDF